MPVTQRAFALALLPRLFFSAPQFASVKGHVSESLSRVLFTEDNESVLALMPNQHLVEAALLNGSRKECWTDLIHNPVVKPETVA